MKKSEDGGTWEEITQHFEDLLSAAHTGEPVVDESDPVVWRKGHEMNVERIWGKRKRRRKNLNFEI
ncbi:MAG: hypothetical protein HBSIN02_16920 [Bacteroidia bacterium]|nr:MAG: hypothetical protein HBSIN02_16920 [Bacteroidia bacterium]